MVKKGKNIKIVALRLLEKLTDVKKGMKTKRGETEARDGQG